MVTNNMPLLMLDPLGESETVCINIKKWDFVMARNDVCFCGSGKKQKRCHPNVHEDGVYANLLTVIHSLDGERAAADLQQCCQGCHDCCADYFYVSITEFVAILKHLEIGGDEYALKRYVWSAKQSSKDLAFPDGNEDRVQLANWPMCIFVDDTSGLCKIYSARPLLCRMYGEVAKITDCAKVSSSNGSLFEVQTDPVTNIDVFLAPNGKPLQPQARPIIYWFSRMTDDGELSTQRMRDLYRTFSSSPVAEFVAILLKP